jgi:tetratricopeptide (TPR) repeat protein
MKKLIVSLAVLAMISTSCAQEKTTGKTDKVNKEQVAPEKPKQANISAQELQANINKGVQEDFAIKAPKDAEEALKILEETQNVLRYIAKNKDKKAKEELAKLIGELEILITKNPNLALLPVNVTYEVVDAVVDIPTVYQITGAAQKAMDDGYYQVAKELLQGLTSEMRIKTTYLPLATYPDAMRLAAAALDEGKKEEAVAILLKALNTLAVVEVKLPLPVLRAEEFIKLAAITMASEEKDKKEIALLFLENAEYQLDLAEAMGYGKKDKEFAELHEAIKVLKKAISEDKETKEKFDSLKVKMKNFKERLFFNKNKK